MEQSVNTFSKGLQLDTSPMVLGNDTLSDALNATFVTMNGNEVILQNDMGNRKVDNAYLPNGYEPVGIKEYGGIIYIAAYNPITNRSLIGSFPSPERRISLVDDENLGGTLNLGIGDNFIFKEGTDDNLGGLHVLKNDTALIPLTSDTSLHAGDKFIVYNVNSNYTDNFNTGLSNGEIITNYDNTILGKIRSPKNKQYTLSLGILNSQNEFVDITSSLVRWNTGNNGSLVDTSNMTELLKFNSGYFIRRLGYSGYFNDKRDKYPIADGELLKERENAYLVMEANTYAYKLVGPLYLLAKLNHILDFSYNIYGTFYKNNTYIFEGELLPTSVLELYVEGYIIYNCPDGLSNSGTGDNVYYKYDDNGTPGFDGFDFIESHLRLTSDLIYGTPEVKYDQITNLYSVKIVKKILIPNINRNDNFNYIIGVRAVNNQVNGNYIYLSGLSDKGIIDVSKLGSGEISLKGWRFHNNYEKKKGTITLNLEAYPKYKETFGDLTVKFTNVINGGNFIYHVIPVRNGKTNIDITWASPEEPLLFNKFWDRALYKVTFYRGLKEGEDSNTDGYDEELLLIQILNPEFYLTTELFNECYIPGNSKFVVDFGDTTNINLYSHILEKLKINYSIECEILDESKHLDPIIDNKILVNSEEYPHIIYTNKEKIDIYFKGIVKYNKKLYPSFITIDDNFRIVKKNNTSLSVTIPNNIIEYNGTGPTSNNSFTYSDITFDNTNFSLNQVDKRLRLSKDEFLYLDKFCSARDNSRQLQDCYVPIDSTVISHLIPGNLSYCGATLDWDTDNHHGLRATISETYKYPFNRDTAKEGNLPKQIEIKNEVNSDGLNYNFSESLVGEQILNNFTTHASKGTIFTWLFGYSYTNENFSGFDPGIVNSISISKTKNLIANTNISYQESSNCHLVSRLWWRTHDNSWALVDGVVNNNNDIATQIFNKLFNRLNYYYCHYKSTTINSISNKYIASSNYYKYNKEYNINIDYLFTILGENIFSYGTYYTNNNNNPILPFSYLEADSEKVINYSTILTSNKTFLNDVENIISSDFSNMVLETGETTDRYGNKLLPNRIYKRTTYGLETVDCDIYIDDSYNDSYRSILYKGYNYSNPFNKYDLSGPSNSNKLADFGVLIYDKLNVISSI